MRFVLSIICLVGWLSMWLLPAGSLFRIPAFIVTVSLTVGLLLRPPGDPPPPAQPRPRR